MKIVKLLTKWIITVAMILVLFLILVFALYYFHGSLEMFPTEEQQGKVRGVTSLIMIVLIILEAGLYIVRRWVIKMLHSEDMP